MSESDLTEAIEDLRDAPPELCQLFVDHQRTGAGRGCRCGWAMGPEGHRHSVHLASVIADLLESRLTVTEGPTDGT